MLKIMVMSHSK